MDPITLCAQSLIDVADPTQLRVVGHIADSVGEVAVSADGVHMYLSGHVVDVIGGSVRTSVCVSGAVPGSFTTVPVWL